MRVTDYVYARGAEPSPCENVYPRAARDGVTTREVFQRGDGAWVVRWTFTPTEEARWQTG